MKLPSAFFGMHGWGVACRGCKVVTYLDVTWPFECAECGGQDLKRLSPPVECEEGDHEFVLLTAQGTSTKVKACRICGVMMVMD